ncbi:DnaJ-domain-containing protein [Punctularia strigosozonata HHB-11173 SS5]|uniref:DnaJ-domain-containing protein n=1 Tax=Punctularia strigosozonata (strain HHB-11173) TaxID=741275 RepID=UPI0004416BC9|nr:DnaJ-domain-containing protein [Punctularia strigosozonata HHB-11173 SS5]EIN14237.1 DnaJ-domain-containing protein [Punctularia strigosozonata HHB-11173 SS5]
MDTHETSTNHYATLGVSPRADAREIKSGYHRALLLVHPDKHSQGDASDAGPRIAAIQEAFRILSTESLRKQYDASLQVPHQFHVPRPAQIVSLEDFDEQPEYWRYPCRCGGAYIVREADMEGGRHLIGCNSCSETVWAGYELAEA